MFFSICVILSNYCYKFILCKQGSSFTCAGIKWQSHTRLRNAFSLDYTANLFQMYLSAGKSTILRLLFRLFDTISGSVSTDSSIAIAMWSNRSSAPTIDIFLWNKFWWRMETKYYLLFHFFLPVFLELFCLIHNNTVDSNWNSSLFLVWQLAFSPWQIQIDGQDTRDVTLDSLRRSIGVVPQDTVCFLEQFSCPCCFNDPY